MRARNEEKAMRNISVRRSEQGWRQLHQKEQSNQGKWRKGKKLDSFL